MTRYSRCSLNVYAALFLLLLAGFIPVRDANAGEDDAVFGEIWKSDVEHYAPKDSYFQLVDDKRNKTNGIWWIQAAERATEMTYKGRRGRLAIIDTPDLQAWVMKHFNFRSRLRNYGGDTLIGLRYMCDSRKLVWVNGKEHPRTAFSFWDVPWYRNENIRCGLLPLPYMGVYIHGETSRWKASGYQKAYPHYLVEYPPNAASKASSTGAPK